MQKSTSIDIKKRYKLPNFKIIEFKNLYLVISPETANWIVLDNDEQLSFFKLLNKYSIEESLQNYSGELKNAQWVLTQLEARQFENTVVVSPADDIGKTIHFYITNSCNLRCPHCYMFSGIKNDNELTEEDIIDVLSQFRELNGENVTFSGGEIMMRSDFCSIVKKSKKLGFKVRLLTNGTLWTKEMVDVISQYADSVQISIDGYSEETNAKVRGKDAFEKSLNTLDWFAQKDCDVEVAVTPWYTDKLAEEISCYTAFAKTIIDRYKGKVKINLAEEVVDGRNVKLTNAEKEKYYSIINKIRSEFYKENTADISFVKSYKDNTITDNCMFGDLSVSSTGDVYCCARISSLASIGNVRESKLQELVKIAQKAHELSNINNFKPCNQCDLKYICGGGCRIDSFPDFVNSDINTLDITQIKPRSCDSSLKNYFYEIMVRTNTKFFK